MKNNKPKVFISSTIYDFKDLRSSIKHYLEELGFEVWLSEYNDFPKVLDQNNIDECLSTLEKADYYILLIGARVGGYYDQHKKISITRMEYQKAYELTKLGKMRCVFLIRDELQKIKSDRQALEDFLKENYIKDNEIASEDQKRIIYHQSSFAKDAEVIFDFINEVSRDEEMKSASEKGSPFPSVNWIHSFTTFRDIVEVLRTNLNISENLSSIALKTNLKREILENLILLTEKYRGNVHPSYSWASFARKAITGDLSGNSNMPSKYITWLCIFSLGAMRATNLSCKFLDEAISSGQFLAYDNETGTFTSTLISDALFNLKLRIENMQKMDDGIQKILVRFMDKYKDVQKTDSDIKISNDDLYVPLALVDRQEDIVNLSVAIIKSLDGNITYLKKLEINSLSPFITETEKMKEETPSIDEIKNWITTL